MIPTKLDAELDELESMPLAELRAAWSRQVRASPPKVSAGLLRLALAHHLQSKVMGGVTKAIERKLQDIADGHAAVRVTPGTRFVREWRGKAHVVTMTEDGRYRWHDRDWASLSMIARTITGTQWSGPAFFGTKTNKRAA
jgi:plastocyanin